MLRNKSEAKKHAYDIASMHVRSFASDIEHDAAKRETNEERQSEKRLAVAMNDIADSLYKRSKMFK